MMLFEKEWINNHDDVHSYFQAFRYKDEYVEVDIHKWPVFNHQ